MLAGPPSPDPSWHSDDLGSGCRMDFSGNKLPPLLSVPLCQPQGFWVIPVYYSKEQIISWCVSLLFVSQCEPVCLNGSVPLSYNKASPSFNSVTALFSWLPHRCPATHPFALRMMRIPAPWILELNFYTSYKGKGTVFFQRAHRDPLRCWALILLQKPPFPSEERNAPQHLAGPHN